MTKKTSQKKKLKPGIYNAQVQSVKVNDNGSVEVQLQLFGKGFTFTERHTLTPVDETIPEVGTMKFFICCSKLGIYTSIGADNRHHAANKATKLFGPHWSSLTQDSYLIRGYVYYEPTNFNREIKTLPI